jgi:hypothetical protein
VVEGVAGLVAVVGCRDDLTVWHAVKDITATSAATITRTRVGPTRRRRSRNLTATRTSTPGPRFRISRDALPER